MFPIQDKKYINEKIIPLTYKRLEKLITLKEEKYIEKLKKKKKSEFKKISADAQFYHHELTDNNYLNGIKFFKNKVHVPREIREIIEWAEKKEDKYRKYIGFDPTK
ncbi:MAG: hypothetical protein KKF48_00585 [Nanoarchaeota archaeon]|nr:hypothetical protein [Nanoarchaeota archaeon]MBU1027519.1 hypothetical protein [Nanoarchaeota archaeon]